MVKPKPGEVWLLATSAMHMPRAMAIATQAGLADDALAHRLLDRARPPKATGCSVGGNLGLADYAVHEWIGMFAYRLTGKAQ